MDRLAYTSSLVRSLRGAALSIWAIMAFNPAKVVWEVDELVTATSYKKDAIMDGRRVLIVHGLAANIGARYGLRLTDSGITQLPLPISVDLIQGSQQGEELSNEVGKIDLEVGKIDLPAVVVDQDIKLIPARADQHQQHDAKSEKSTSLTAAGIHGKKRRNLLEDEWVTADRIEAWSTEIAGMAAAGYNFRDQTGAGFMISQLEAHIEPPEHKDRDAYGDKVDRDWERVLQRPPYIPSVTAADIWNEL